MRLIANGNPNQRVARHPWDRAVITPHSLTIPSTGWQSSYEVPMSFPDHKFFHEDDCRERYAYNVLWTQAASGGCWPFAVMARNTGADRATKPLSGMALAHLAYDRENEVRVMGRLFRMLIGAPAADIFLIAMIPAALASQAEIQMVKNYAFFAFEVGFRARIPNGHRILLTTNTVNAGITRLGYFGELSNQDVADLAQSRLPANRPCAVF